MLLHIWRGGNFVEAAASSSHHIACHQAYCKLAHAHAHAILASWGTGPPCTTVQELRNKVKVLAKDLGR